MLTPHLFCVALALFACGCGRLGVELLTAAAPSGGGVAADSGADADTGPSAPVIRDGAIPGNVPIDAGTTAPGTAADAGRDATPDPDLDAAVEPVRDAAVDAAAQDSGAVDAAVSDAGPVDAGMDAAVDASAPAPCAGASALGVCWYLGAQGASCDETCTRHGGFDARAIAYVGIPRQGGSVSECRTVLTALGRSGSVIEATRDDDHGLGCHVWNDGKLFWLTEPSPEFRSSVSGTGVRIACGCAR